MKNRNQSRIDSVGQKKRIDSFAIDYPFKSHYIDIHADRERERREWNCVLMGVRAPEISLDRMNKASRKSNVDVKSNKTLDDDGDNNNTTTTTNNSDNEIKRIKRNSGTRKKMRRKSGFTTLFTIT